ncbi:MAG TPA: hypothetical protein VLB04_11315 [Methanotrichaceae archaeon]|nr:hypothetical protein [Methanotrichaceae archaeon]
MAKQSNESNQPRRAEPRESDNPVLEDFKEDLMHRTSFGTRPIITSDAERLARLEGFIAELHERMKSLERRIGVLEGKR